MIGDTLRAAKIGQVSESYTPGLTNFYNPVNLEQRLNPKSAVADTLDSPGSPPRMPSREVISQAQTAASQPLRHQVWTGHRDGPRLEPAPLPPPAAPAPRQPTVFRDDFEDLWQLDEDDDSGKDPFISLFYMVESGHWCFGLLLGQDKAWDASQKGIRS